MNSYQIVLLILSVGVLLVAYNTLAYKSMIEEYDNYHTKDFKSMSVFRHYSPLYVIGCVRHRVREDIMQQLSEICYTSYTNFYSISAADIYDAIITDLGNTVSINRGGRINGPAYAIIFKRPTPDEDPYYAPTISVGSEASLTSLYVVYPKYSTSMKEHIDDTSLRAFEDYCQRQKTNNEFCFLHCNKKDGKCVCSEKNNTNTKDCGDFDGSKWQYGMAFRIDEGNQMFRKHFNRLQ